MRADTSRGFMRSLAQVERMKAELSAVEDGLAEVILN